MSINFKSEEEVKDYLKNLGIEYRFGCFKENKPEVCHLLGDYLEAIDRNYDKAWKVYLNNCNSANFGKSCYKCANYTLMGRGGQKTDRVKALEFFEKSCELGEMNGCFQAGILSSINSASMKPLRTFKQATALLEKACEGNHHNACYRLSGLYYQGSEKENVAKDMKRCFEYSLKACNLDNMYACANLSMMYRSGDGVEKSVELADKYKARAIEIQEEVTKSQTLAFQEGLSPT